MKKHILSTVISSLLLGATASYAEDLQFQFRIPLKAQLSNWSGVEPIYHPWLNVGSHYNCADWSPLAATIDFGKDFTQSRDCKQNQERHVEIRELDSFSGAVKTIRNEQENRSVTETESQSAVGTYQNWVSHDSTFTEWADKNTAHSFTPWTPEPIAQTTRFTQSRDYKQPQERYEQKREIDTVTGDIKNTGERILRTQDDKRTEDRSVSVNWTAWENTKRDGFGEWLPVEYTETADFKQSRVYGQHQNRDRIYGTTGDELKRIEESRVVSPLYEDRSVTVKASNWTNTTRIDFSNWTPAATTQIAGFPQTRTYTQNQDRTWSYKSGGEELKTRLETRAVSNQSETQSVLVAWSAWVNKGTHYDCGDWTPTTNFIPYGVAYTQTRTCKQDQTRNRIYSVGSTTINTAAEAQTINETESQAATGLKDSIVSQTYGDWSNWTNSGDVYGCSSWSPEPSTVCSGSTFTQARTCSQNQTRSRTVTSVWASGARSSAGNESGAQTISAVQNQSSTGTKNCWAPAASDITAWSTYATDYSAWSPAASTQGSNFDQTRAITAYQEQYEQKKEYNSSTGAYRNVGTPVRTTRAVSGGTESRTAVVTNSGWVNSGAAYNCGGYSPDPSTVSTGQVYTQYGSCSQNQIAYYTYSVGGTYQFGSQTVSIGDSRSAIGTKPINGVWVFTSAPAVNNSLAAVEYFNASAVISGQSCSPIGSTTITTFNYRNGPYSSNVGTAYWSCQ